MCCRETIRAALHRLKLSWKKARSCWAGPTRSGDRRSSSSSKMFWPALNAIDISWSTWMRRTSTRTRISATAGPNAASASCASSSPGLSARVSFYGLYLYNEGQVRLWPYPRANGEHTMDVLRRLRAEFPDEALIVLWDGAP